GRRGRVGGLATTAVGGRVRSGRSAEQGEPQLVAAGRHTVRGGREQGDAEAVLGEVGEAVGGDLEAGEVGLGVRVRRALGDAELHLGGGRGGADVQRERDAQQLV